MIEKGENFAFISSNDLNFSLLNFLSRFDFILNSKGAIFCLNYQYLQIIIQIIENLLISSTYLNNLFTSHISDRENSTKETEIKEDSIKNMSDENNQELKLKINIFSASSKNIRLH